MHIIWPKLGVVRFYSFFFFLIHLLLFYFFYGLYLHQEDPSPFL